MHSHTHRKQINTKPQLEQYPRSYLISYRLTQSNHLRWVGMPQIAPLRRYASGLP